MNEEALQYSYDLFSKDGYNGSIDDYKKLINEDQEALDYTFSLFCLSLLSLFVDHPLHGFGLLSFIFPLPPLALPVP